MPDEVVVIRPRNGVSAERVQRWLEEQFQQPMTEDAGDNPLVNADIAVQRACPYCSVAVSSVEEETEHMMAAHRDIVDKRLRAAGELPPEPPAGEEHGVPYDAWCIECREDGKHQRVTHRMGAWWCPVHHDRGHVEFTPHDHDQLNTRLVALRAGAAPALRDCAVALNRSEDAFGPYEATAIRDSIRALRQAVGHLCDLADPEGGPYG